MDCFVAWLLAMTGVSFVFNSLTSPRVCIYVLAARCARGLRLSLALENRGRRESRVRTAPAVSCASCTKKRTREPRRLKPLAVLESGAPERYVAFGSFGMTKLPQLRWEYANGNAAFRPRLPLSLASLRSQ